ncbi:MAG: hypothetical protein QME44_01760 [Thermodesulfobacteriota bacterium]|nr:hypothetical protein [Thermodesulfobacteriota bacterium]
MGYSDARYRTLQQVILPGNDQTTMLNTPQAGTAVETKAHTKTMAIWAPGRNITLKKLCYTIVTAQTGAGNNMTLDLYKGATSVGTLAVTTTAALGRVAQSADMDVAVADTDYLRIYAISTTTASGANCATGVATLTYQEAWV